MLLQAALCKRRLEGSRRNHRFRIPPAETVIQGQVLLPADPGSQGARELVPATVVRTM
jgi:hypothetical protein